MLKLLLLLNILLLAHGCAIYDPRTDEWYKLVRIDPVKAKCEGAKDFIKCLKQAGVK